MDLQVFYIKIGEKTFFLLLHVKFFIELKIIVTYLMRKGNTLNMLTISLQIQPLENCWKMLFLRLTRYCRLKSHVSFNAMCFDCCITNRLIFQGNEKKLKNVPYLSSNINPCKQQKFNYKQNYFILTNNQRKLLILKSFNKYKQNWLEKKSRIKFFNHVTIATKIKENNNQNSKLNIRRIS